MSSVSNEVVAVEQAVVDEAKAVKQAVVEEVKKVEVAVERTVQELQVEERLVIREIENEYLKAQMEINRLSQITQKCQKDFTAKVEELTKKYAVNPAEWLFDNVSLIFKKK